MAFDNLTKALNQFAGVSENPQSLDAIDANSGQFVQFGALGDFANKIDKSAQRTYYEDGWVGNNIRPRQLEILMQQPDITLLIKKRLFSSLIENFKTSHMDATEKLFIRCVKAIFQKKCQLISTYEQLTKIDKIIGNSGGINTYLFPLIMSGIDSLDQLGQSNLIDAGTRATLETVRQLQVFSNPNPFTTWLIDKEIPSDSLGLGTGVFELTNLTNIDTLVSTQFNAGSCSFSVEDPYKLMVITPADIDSAIQENFGSFLNNAFFKVTEEQLAKLTDDLRTQLNVLRDQRQVPRINFKINETNQFFKKVRAFFDLVGIEINFTYDAGAIGIGGNVSLDTAATQGTIGLQKKEVDLFQQILQNTYQLLGLRQSTTANKFTFNKQTNYVRRKLMLHFGNKCMIQPMDVVNIFVSSKTKLDSKIGLDLSNAFSGNQIVKSINDVVDDISNAFSGSSNNFAATEKNAIAGVDFPMWLWQLLRNDFTRQAAGTHVFAGLVNNANHNYSVGNGKYVVDVSCTDNGGFFKQSKININPSVEVYNSALYDPLTPFDLEFDASSGLLRGEFPNLLPENKLLLDSGSVKFKSGRNRGQPASQEIFQAVEMELVKDKIRKKTENPDGLAYRWKEGIQSLTLLTEPHLTGNEFLPNETSPKITKDPWAGQDCMNVLSLLVTGQPYNFNTFMKAALNSGSISLDQMSNESGISSFYQGLLNDITKSNATWGNFLPFKKLVINEGAYKFLQSGEFDLSTSNRQLSDLLRQRAQRFDQLVKVLPQLANNPQYLSNSASGNLATFQLTNIVGNTSSESLDAISKLGSDIIKLDLQIKQMKDAFVNKLTDGSIRIYGNDISYDASNSEEGSNVKEEDRIRQREDFRKRINYLTQRRLWRTKANQDQNLFIVDDAYDKNYDIQAFEQALSGQMDQFKSNYEDIATQIMKVSQILGLEVFADSQGHIQARPPQYNRMPSSVFFKMIQNQDATGIQLFPPFLSSLFVNMVQGLTDRLEILEDQIRIRSAVIGYITDDDAAHKLLSGRVSPSGSGGSTFAFLTDEFTGMLGSKDIRSLIDSANPDLQSDKINQSLQSLTAKLVGFKAPAVNFDIAQRVTIVNETQFAAGINEVDINSRINLISKRLQTKTEGPVVDKTSLINTNNLSSNFGRSQLDVLNITEQIANYLSERQDVIKLLTNALKNLKEGNDLNTGKESGRTALEPFINKQKQFPEIIAHMIEDEDIDDLGENSGKRYVIKEHQIINLSIRETPPPFTMVEVVGLFAEGLAEPPSGLSIDSGNAVSSAWAVDFDLWRMYGFRGTQTFQAPFLSDPDTQCAPYAVLQLNLARRNVLQGSITIVGNEFIQAGEVYYIEDRNLLFYAETVRHNFTYGGNFTTSIELKYGHNPGEYIPTILDIVGKGLYTNKHQADLIRHNRHGQANGDVPLSVVVMDKPGLGNFGSPGVEALVTGTYGDQNRNALTNLTLAVDGLAVPNSTIAKIPQIELRVYHNSDQGIASSSDLEETANSIKTWIFNPTQDLNGQSLAPDQTFSKINNIQIDTDNFKVVTIDLGDPKEKRSPSQTAWNRARELDLVGHPNSAPDLNIDQDGVDEEAVGSGVPELFSQVIDIWVTFSTPEQTTGINKNDPNPNSQSTQDQTQQAIDAFNAKIQSLADNQAIKQGI